MTKSIAPKLSVVITCYNYGAFVADAINSILQQNATVDIVVVDDCSKDNSRDIIASFGDQITAVFQDVNQGHGGGFNKGFSVTNPDTDLIMFLDADDFLLPGAVDTIVGNYQADIVMYHYRMRYADEGGALAGFHPAMRIALGQGDISKQLRETGRYNGQITSGLVFSRQTLEKVMPMDPESYRQGGDGYLSAVVPLYGACQSFDAAISGYRLHGMQHSKFQAAYAKRARWRIGHDEERYHSIRHHSEKLGLSVSDDLSDRDPSHLEERLVSVLFDPENHPIAGDTVTSLSAKIANVQVSQKAFWKAFSIAPSSFKRIMMQWRIDPLTRPHVLVKVGRFARTMLSR
ncbi:MAG: glycosyltransferase family 2 protein [Pseudomonadota bacterium]